MGRWLRKPISVQELEPYVGKNPFEIEAQVKKPRVLEVDSEHWVALTRGNGSLLRAAKIAVVVP